MEVVMIGTRRVSVLLERTEDVPGWLVYALDIDVFTHAPTLADAVPKLVDAVLELLRVGEDVFARPRAPEDEWNAFDAVIRDGVRGDPSAEAERVAFWVDLEISEVARAVPAAANFVGAFA